MTGLLAAWRTFWSRSDADRGRLLRAALSTLAERGLVSTLRRARQSAALAADREAENRRYAAWCRRHTPDAATLETMAAQIPTWHYQPVLSIVTPVYNTPPALLAACAESVLTQIYPKWEWHLADDGSTNPDTLAVLDTLAKRDRRIHVHHLAVRQGISGATNVALAAATGEYVGLLDHDDALMPHAAFRVVAHLNHAEVRPDVIYSDEDKLEEDGTRTDAYFKPDWSPDLFLSNMYICHWLVARRSLVEEVGGFRSAFDFSQDYDLGLRLMDRTSRIDHIADVLYNWRKGPQSTASAGSAKPRAHLAGQRALDDYLQRNRINGRVDDAGAPGFFRVVFDLARRPLVSIIGVEDQEDRRLLRSSTAYVNLEFAASAEAASGELLLFLDPSFEATTRDWLEALVQIGLRPGVGAVGGRLLAEDGTLEHIGLVLGLAGVAGRPLAGTPAGYPGYFGSAMLIRTVSAVTADCLLTRRDVFAQTGQTQACLHGDADGVDYGLRLRQLGLRVVFTPACTLQRREGSPITAISDADAERLRAAWGLWLARDPYYNPNLSTAALDYRVAV
jgi:glycosyltransferase involved in cell wall biosynthesis